MSQPNARAILDRFEHSDTGAIDEFRDAIHELVETLDEADAEARDTILRELEAVVAWLERLDVEAANRRDRLYSILGKANAEG